MGTFFWDFGDYSDIERYRSRHIENGRCSSSTLLHSSLHSTPWYVQPSIMEKCCSNCCHSPSTPSQLSSCCSSSSSKKATNSTWWDTPSRSSHTFSSATPSQSCTRGLSPNIASKSRSTFVINSESAISSLFSSQLLLLFL